jgi:hypothetical protein
VNPRLANALDGADPSLRLWAGYALSRRLPLEHVPFQKSLSHVREYGFPLGLVDVLTLTRQVSVEEGARQVVPNGGVNDVALLPDGRILAMIESQQGNFDRAEPLWLKVLAARRNGDRPDSGTLSNLAYTRVEQKKYSDAETVIRQSLATDQSLSPSSWNVFRDRVLLGAALAGQGKFQDGEPLLLSGFEGLIRTENNIPQDYRFYLAASEHWIDQLYQDWGRPDRAAEWKLKLQGLRTASFRK